MSGTQRAGEQSQEAAAYKESLLESLTHLLLAIPPGQLLLLRTAFGYVLLFFCFTMAFVLLLSLSWGFYGFEAGKSCVGVVVVAVAVVCVFGSQSRVASRRLASHRVRANAPFQGYFALWTCLAAFWHFIVSLARIERKKLNV